MNEPQGGTYYLSRKPEILTQFDTHAMAWKPFLFAAYGIGFAETVLRDAREQVEALIPEIPYIGGDENPMTRHLVRSTTSLVLYKIMKARGKTAAEAGKIVYDAVVDAVGQLPPGPAKELSAETIAEERQRAQRSQECYWPGGWVWEFVLGDGVAFDYGYDFLECGTQKLYHTHDADEFLPFYCYLDFVTHRTPGWGFARSMTLAEGCEKCDFRYKRGGGTKRAWPPPFPKGGVDDLSVVLGQRVTFAM